MAATSSESVRGIWRCVSPHVSATAPRHPGQPLGRSSSAAAIIGHRLVVFSGENTPRVPVDDTVHIFDIRSGEWSTLAARKSGTTTAGPCARVGHTAAAVEGRMLVFGGRTAFEAGDSTLADLWSLDVETGEWTDLSASMKGSAPPGLSYHSMAACGPLVYVFGGCRADHVRTNGLWRFDTRSNEWSVLSAHADKCAPEAGPCGRGGPGLAAGENELWVGFGYNGQEEQSDLWRFDLTAGKWERIVAAGGCAPEARSVTDLVWLPAQKQVFVFGGEFTPSAQGHEGAGEYHANAFLFDVTSRRWMPCVPQPSASSSTDSSAAAAVAAAVPAARGWFNTCRYGDGGDIIVFGGFDGKERRNDVWMWSPEKV